MSWDPKEKSELFRNRESGPNIENEVGYGKPPKHTRFKAGKSGNPRGRPKKRFTIAQIVDRELNRIVKIKLDGKLVRMAVIEALVRKVTANAFRDDNAARKLF